MKPSTAIILAVAGVAILVIYSRSKSSTPLIGGKPATSSSSGLTGFLGGLGLGLGGGAVLGGLGKSSSSSGGSSSSNTSTALMDASNYISDQTAASDDASGVVGFGGWGDD